MNILAVGFPIELRDDLVNAGHHVRLVHDLAELSRIIQNEGRQTFDAILVDVKSFDGMVIGSGRAERPELPAHIKSLFSGRIEVDSQTYRATLDGKPVTLTKSQYRFLIAIAQLPQSQSVFTRSELLPFLENPKSDERTVDVWIGRLRSRFDAVYEGAGREFVGEVRGTGYRIVR